MPLRLLFLLKAPVTGAVKTRLAEAIGNDRALGAYKRMGEHLIRNLAPAFPVEIFFCPAGSEGDYEAELLTREWLTPVLAARAAEVPFLLQAEGDLGARQAHAVAVALERAPGPVCLLGGDCPYLDRARLNEAQAALVHNDVVIGPAQDGGYYLLAMNQAHPRLFEQVPWSSPDTFLALQTNAHDLGLSVHLLDLLEDVDTPEAWERARQSAGII
jgi:rSAM/selenodomain-associated transferase 1